MRQRRRLPVARTAALVAVAGACSVPAGAQAAVTVDDVQVAETNAAATATFTLTRTAGVLAAPTSVTVRTADATAAAPGDYVALAPTTVSFPATALAGMQVRRVAVTVVGDQVDEPAEAFDLVVEGAEVTDPSGTATILDDDPPAPAPVPPSRPPADAAPTGPLRIGLGAPRLRRPATALVTVACPARVVRCRGTLTLRTRAERRARELPLRRTRTLGRRTVSIVAGRTTTVRLRLRKADRELLRRAGRLKVRATASVTDAAGRRARPARSGTLIARLKFSD